MEAALKPRLHYQSLQEYLVKVFDVNVHSVIQETLIKVHQKELGQILME